MKKLFLILIFTFITVILALNAGALDVNEAFSFEEFSFEGEIMPYRLYVPQDYSEENEYPLVVFLHGAGERGKDNDIQLKNAVQTLFDRADGLMAQSIVIAPQCPEGEQWVDTPWADGNYSVDAVPESNELQTVVALVSSIKESYSVDSARVYAMGVSMGGFGTWDLMIRHNDIFAAAAPMCGGSDPSKASLLVDTPIYTFHGTADSTVPFEGTEEMVGAIEYEGGRLINFVVYDGDGHGIWEKAAAEADWVEWLFSQKLTDRYSAPETEPMETETEPVTEATEEITTEAPAIKENEATPVSSEEKENSSLPLWAVVVIAVVVLSNIIIIVVIKSKKNK